MENVCRALTKVRDVLAEVFAERIAAGDFDEPRAIQSAHRWLHNNPREIYFLS